MDLKEYPQEQGTLSVAEYAAALNRTGTRSLPGSGPSLWVSYETSGMLRMPTFYSERPAAAEVHKILWTSRAAVASYITDPDEDHPANTWLYTCQDREYNLAKLSHPAQRCIRRAQRNLLFSRVDLPALLNFGFAAYIETRRRIGLSDGTVQKFQKRFTEFAKNPAHQFIGAWRGHVLVAFATIIVVADWVEIPGSFSTNTHRDLRPNDGLINFILEDFLVRRRFSIVSYGLSSVQESADLVGLHTFKTKVGFQAQPVHRAFVFHPLLRPFANRMTLWGTKTALRLCPNARWLRKAGGVLACALGDGQKLETI